MLHGATLAHETLTKGTYMLLPLNGEGVAEGLPDTIAKYKESADRARDTIRNLDSSYGDWVDEAVLPLLDLIEILPPTHGYVIAHAVSELTRLTANRMDELWALATVIHDLDTLANLPTERHEELVRIIRDQTYARAGCKNVYLLLNPDDHSVE